MRSDSASPSANAEMAAAVISAAIESGVGEWVIGAGARNLPLIESLMAMPEWQRGRVWNFFEERSAAFFALGRMKAGNRRVAVVTTSGTAAAELLPATIEAHYSGHDLLLITADRPAEFRGTGAPQAIEQTQLLSPYVSRTVDWATPEDRATVADSVPRSAPEHWNVCFAEPRSDDGVVEVAVGVSDFAIGKRSTDARPGEIAHVEAFCSSRHDGNLVVLLGELSEAESQAIEAGLADLGAPIWAEAISGLRESQKLRQLMITNGEIQIAALNPTRVLHIGGVPSCRFWRDLETQPEIEVMSLTRTGFSGLARNSEVVRSVKLSCEQREPGAYANRGVPLDEMLERFPTSEPALFRRLSERIASDALIFLGNSLPIREWNLAASLATPHPHCFASRGANGIDGQISTFLGLSADAEDPRADAWGIFGDLTTLYDLSGPFVLAQLPSATKRRIVVINNGGGRIFDRLPAVQAGSVEQQEVIRNSNSHDFQHWAAMWGMGYACWSADGDWVEPAGVAIVIEIRPDETQTAEFWNAWEKESR